MRTCTIRLICQPNACVHTCTISPTICHCKVSVQLTSITTIEFRPPLYPMNSYHFSKYEFIFISIIWIHMLPNIRPKYEFIFISIIWIHTFHSWRRLLCNYQSPLNPEASEPPERAQGTQATSSLHQQLKWSHVATGSAFTCSEADLRKVKWHLHGGIINGRRADILLQIFLRPPT